MSYLLRRGGVYYCRVVVPLDLKKYFSSNEIKRTLRTTSKAEARQLVLPVLYEIQARFKELRDHMKRPITADAVAAFKRLYPGMDTHVWVDHVQPLGRWGAASVGPKQVPVPELSIIQKQLDEGWQLNSNDEWEFVGIQARPTTQAQQEVKPAAPPPQIATHDTSILLSKASELYLEHCKAPSDSLHNKPRASSTFLQEQYALKNLAAWVGRDRPAHEVAAMDFKKLSKFLHEEGKLVKPGEPKEGLAKSSLNVRLNCLTRFFKFLKDSKFITDVPVIKFVPLQGDEKLKTSNLPYSNEELKILFNHIVDNRPRKLDDRKYLLSLTWLLLTFLYTGFRRSEQLSFTADKVKTAGKVHYFDFTYMSKDNTASIRMVPLHSKLISLGMLDFIAKQKDHIFERKADTYQASFNRLAYKSGIKNRTREKTFHSFRATFDSKLMGKVEDSVRKKLMGHTLKGMDAIYCSQLIDEMPMYQKAINTLDYDIDFDKLKEYLRTELSELYR